MNKVVLVLVLTTAAASIACMHLVAELRDERADAETLQNRIAELERTVAQRERVASSTPARTSPFSPFTTVVEQELERSGVEKTAAPTESRSSSAPPQMDERVRELFARRRELMQDPKYQEAMRKQQRVHMESMYPGLEEALGLSHEDRSRFLDLLAQQQTEDMAQDSMVRDPSDAEAVRKAQEAFMQRQQRHQEEIDSQFGPSVRQRWAEYQETLGQRHRVAALQSQLALAGTPLDAEQSKAVLNALVDEQRRQTQEHMNAQAGLARVGFVSHPGAVSSGMDWALNAKEWAQSQERSHQRVLNALQSSLTSEQIEHIEGIFSREREAQRASMELMRVEGMGQENVMFATGAVAAPVAGFSMSVAPLEVSEVSSSEE